MVLGMNTYTPIPYWTEMPLRQFVRWIQTSNEVQREMKPK